MPKAPQRLALTEKLVAAVERMEPDSGPEAAFVLMSDDDFAAAARNFLDQLGGGPIRVFAYGSLIWKQAFEHEQAERGRTHGWRRSFCLDIVRWRATPQQPGLMLALDRGGSCDGVVFRLPDRDHQAQMERLLRRECAYRQDLKSFRWLKVRTASGMFPAFTFYAAPMSPGYHIDLPIEQQARRIAMAAGHIGSNATYLHNTIVKLMEHGIHDSYLWRLQALVAEEILQLHPNLRD